ncbi:hypothetical protein RhiJN_13096 [Ceratobasidium sp. AG-Ba]|nr:hypothetical protein RhiJN_13096 [Ceratobasidium sp. AG-Ba]
MFKPSGLEPGKPSENVKTGLPRLAPDLGTLNVFERRIPQPGTALDDLVSKHAPEAAKALVDVQVVESPGFDVPTRPNTPPMLRDFTRNIPGLLERANGPADGRDYGWPSPPEPSPPSTPSSTRSEVSAPAYPHSLTSRDLTVKSRD